MPFRKSARITVTNESEKPCDAFYYYVDWQKHESLPDDTAYFHAMYRQEFPCVMGRNYLMADIEGRGHYVGTVQSVFHVSPGWYGEGDDFFFIDGEKEPSLRGTGTEDYFCDGWGFRQQDGPFYGTPLWEGYDDGRPRFRLSLPHSRPVVFKKSLRAEIEHKGSQTFPDGKGEGFIERDDLMSSVAFWYQTEPHKPWPALPPGRDRLPLPRNESPGCRQGRARYEALGRASSEQRSPARPKASNFSSNRQTARPGWKFPSAWKNGSVGNLSLRACHAADYGIYSVFLDGEPLGQFDFFAPESVSRRRNSAGATFRPAIIRFDSWRGQKGESKGYFLGIDSLSIESTVYSRSPKVDPRTPPKK